MGKESKPQATTKKKRLKPVSLNPLGFDDAMRALVSVGPKPLVRKKGGTKSPAGGGSEQP